MFLGSTIFNIRQQPTSMRFPHHFRGDPVSGELHRRGYSSGHWVMIHQILGHESRHVKAFESHYQNSC